MSGMKPVVVAAAVTAVLSAFAIEPYPERSIYFATHFFNWFDFGL